MVDVSFDIAYKICFEVAAALFDIVLYTYLSIRFVNRGESSRRFRGIVIYILIGIFYDIFYVLLRGNISTISSGVTVFLFALKISLVLVVYHIVSMYVESSIHERAQDAKLHIFNKVLIYIVLTFLLLQMIWCWVHNGEDMHRNYSWIRLICGFLIPAYLTIYVGGELLASRSNINRRYVVVVIFCFFFLVSSFISQSILDEKLEITYFGLSIALHILFFTLESPDYQNLLETLEKLEVAKEEAKAASNAKSKFLSQMSHEIRTPINSVLGLDEIIIRETKEPSVAEYARQIQSSGRTLLGIINDILDFAKIEAGKREILEENYELNSLVDDCYNIANKSAREKGLSFVLDVDPQMPSLLYGDYISMEQIINNLLSNAIKYTETGSVILRFGYEELEPPHMLLCVSVEDTGRGIAPEDIKRLLSPFDRIEEKKSRTITGTGLGLSIVDELLHLMDSKLEVESTYGKGSTFSFKVRQTKRGDEVIGNLLSRFSVENFGEYEALFWAPEAAILAVDDTEPNLLVFKGLLKETGMQIDTATSGEEMLAMVTNKSYDLIFLDHMMPGMDGIETLHRMRELPSCINADTPVVALTANAISGAKEYYMQEGFYDYLAKPINSKLLETMVMHHLPKEKIQNRSQAQGHHTQTSFANLYPQVKGIDFEMAKAYCRTAEIWEETAKNFYAQIPELIEHIGKFLEQENIEQYTIKVHALKSSARLIGAAKLSANAAELENAGNQNAIDFIKEKTPTLLAQLLSYRERLGSLDGKDKGKAEKPVMELQMLKEAYTDLKEMVEAFDFRSAEEILSMIEGYQLPQEEVERFEKIQTLVRKVDRTGLIGLL